MPSPRRPYDPPVSFTTGEILLAIGVGVAFAALIAGYMIFTRRKGWM